MKNGRIVEVLQSGAVMSLVNCVSKCLQECDGCNGEREVLQATKKVFEILKRCSLQDADAKVSICQYAVPKLLVSNNR